MQKKQAVVEPNMALLVIAPLQLISDTGHIIRHLGRCLVQLGRAIAVQAAPRGHERAALALNVIA